MVERRFLKCGEAAELLRWSPQTLANKRWRGEGPPFIRLSARCVRYDLGELIEWVRSHQEDSESREDQIVGAVGGNR